MKHNNMRDEIAKHAYLSRNPVTIDSKPDDGYKARYEAAMELVRDLLYYATAIEEDYDKSVDRYKELRDSE